MNAKAIAAWVLGGGVGVAILALAMQFWISVNVASQLKGAGIVPASEVAIMREDIDDIERLHKSDSERMDSKIERIVDILLEE